MAPERTDPRRVCRFEQMEPRRMLDANPVVAGVTYLEGDTGTDDGPDYFEITFQGGSPTTTMTQFVINGDQDGNGTLSDGDMFFDVSAAYPGTGGFHPFQFNAARSAGISASEITSVNVSADGLRLTVTVNGFVAGDRLAFTLDVDEVERDRVDKIASGVEFEQTLFQTTFADPHYNFHSRDVSVIQRLEHGIDQTQRGGIFYDEYDQLFARAAEWSGAVLQLPLDNAQQAANRSDGAIAAFDLAPKPISISGRVYHDVDMDCLQDAGESGISGVQILLEKFNATTGQYQQVAATTTGTDGGYRFGTELNLLPGKYRIIEVQPDGYLSVGAMPGTVEGIAIGRMELRTGHPNVLADVVIPLGNTAAINYDFCEVHPASISGHVWHDRNDDGAIDSGEERLANVLIEIRRVGTLPGQSDPFAGTAPIQVRTDGNGLYQAIGLPPGVYEVIEINSYPTGPNPLAGYIDGKDALGNVGGVANGIVSNDRFSQVQLRPDNAGVQYNFGELQLGRISGFVATDHNGNCVLDTEQGERPLANVTMQLLNGQQQVIATTTTDANGYYAFIDLRPGSYSIRQVQPGGYFTVDQSVGKTDAGAPGTGDNSFVNEIRGIQIGSGAVLVEYNFCEQAPGKIQGRVFEDGPVFSTSDGQLPQNYRAQRDGVYQSGTDRPIAGARMTLWYYNDIAGGSLNPRPVTLADVLPGFYPHMEGMPADTPVFLVTGADGKYSFEGLRAGNYIVLQDQPTGFSDANDVAGSTTGFVFNSEVDVLLAPAILAETFTPRQLMDSINAIQIGPAGQSLENNFTEVRVQRSPVQPPEFPIPPRPPIEPPLPPVPPPAPGWGLYGAQPLTSINVISSSVIMAADAAGYTWHLSVINAGDPRGDAQVAQSRESVWMNASFSDSSLWQRSDMDQVSWSLGVRQGDQFQLGPASIRFGMSDGFPLAGDWNGDGIDEIGVFSDGFFLIDINGDRAFDASDLVAQLGTEADQPVVGDWDGDGKDDVGIFGPEWPKDPEAIAHDPGLPDPANRMVYRPKNAPPSPNEAAEGTRIMRLTSSGKARADLIDHVFRFGDPADLAVAGDWNGSGIRTIGVFNHGTWRLDANGDGRWTDEDIECVFGEAGDRPVVGDFNGDGIDEIGVYRNGTWIIDTNGNHEQDAQDLVFQLGDRSDYPVVGDFDGDGLDEPALFHGRPSARIAAGR
jgi:hypothetical protein